MAKAIISSTYDNNYLYFLPMVTWLWNKLGVNVICFMPPNLSDYSRVKKATLVQQYLHDNNLKCQIEYFYSQIHKESTYAQCSRLYGACLDLPEDEVLITGDVDLLTFKLPPYISGFTIYGSDLVPQGQYPMCFISAKVKDWRNAFSINTFNAPTNLKTYQECLDETIGDEECENMRGNLWCRDQETAYNKINLTQELNLIPRSNGQNQFAQNRYDRDDLFILDRLSPDTIDFHMNRPGYEDKNFEIILTILKYHYPDENFQWLIDYTNAYKQLL